MKKLILYTYDAFVFDVHPTEKQYLYTECIIKSINSLSKANQLVKF